MSTIAQNLNQFHQAIQTDQLISIDSKTGTWSAKTSFFKPILIYSYEGKVIQAFNQALDELEKIPLYFENNILSTEHEPLKQYLDISKSLEKRISSHFYLNTKLSNELRNLKIKTAALAARLTLKKENHNALLLNLQEMGTQLKKQDPLAINKNLTEQDTQAILKLAEYPDYSQLILSDKALQTDFYKRVMRAQLPVNFFVEYPKLLQTIVKSFLDKRVSRLGFDGLKVKMEEIPESPLKKRKIVSLLIEGKEESVLDPTKLLSFKHDYQLTVQKMFNMFANKNASAGNLEFTANGISNWNSCEKASWNENLQKFEYINFSENNWWEQLPPVETLSSEDVLKHYGQQLAPDQIGLCAKGSRGHTTLFPLDAHSWLEILIPTSDGKHQVYPIGNYAAIWPVTFVEELQAVCSTQKAKMQYPDENIFRNDRQKGLAFYPLDKNKGEQLLEIIKQDLIKNQNGKMIFQASDFNCASWVQSVFNRLYGKEKSPKLYWMSVWDVHLKGPPKWTFGTIRSIPHSGLRNWCFDRFVSILGGNNGLIIEEDNKPVFKSVMTGNLIKIKMMNNPSLLVHNYLRGIPQPMPLI